MPTGGDLGGGLAFHSTLIPGSTWNLAPAHPSMGSCRRLRGSPIRRVAWIATVIALASLLATGLDIGSAEEGDEVPETFVTVLEPGDNLIGWTTDVAPVETLFEAIPEIGVVWGWDVDWRRWRLASPSLPRSMWTIGQLKPGMGLRIRLTGDRTVDWERPRHPSQGTVTLKPGWNLVAWLGRDGAPLDRVIRGIGRSTERVGIWAANTREVRLFAPNTIVSAGKDTALMFGDALWVKVVRTVNWLQPTGLLPEIVLAGDIPRPVQEQTRVALREAIDLTFDLFGLEADFSRYKAFFAHDYESYVDAFNSNLPAGFGPLESSPLAKNGFQARSGFASASDLLVRTDLWGSVGSVARSENGVREVSSGARTTLHEYTHVLQRHLLGNFDNDPSFVAIEVPIWFEEGMARWVENVQLNANGTPWPQLSEQATRRAKRLSNLTRGLSNGEEYPLGAAAAFALAPEHTDDSLFELYRQLAPNRVGPNGRWFSWRDWPSAFDSTYGISEQAFYGQFNLGRSPATTGGEDVHYVAPPRLTLLVTDSRASAVAETVSIDLRDRITGRRYYVPNVTVGRPISLALDEGSSYSVVVVFGTPSCLGIWSEDGLVAVFEEADVLLTRRDSKFNLNVDLADDPCPHVIRGKLLTESGRPLSGIRIRFNDETGSGQRQGVPGHHSPSVLTGVDGAFEFLVPQGMRGTIFAELTPTCSVAEQVVGVPRQHAGSIILRVPDRACSLGISGRLLDVDGLPISDARISIVSDRQGISGWTDSRGVFEIHPSFSLDSGRFYVSASIDGCEVYFNAGGATNLRGRATQVQISDDDVTGIEIRMMPGLCGHRITGTLLNADGTPRSGQRVLADGYPDGSGNAWTDPDGAFSLAVPVSGSYRLSTRIDGCWIYLGSRGPTSDWGVAAPVHVIDADVTGIEFRLPEEPTSFCN